MLRIPVLLTVLISTVSCAPFGFSPSGGKPVGEIYAEATGGQARELTILPGGSRLSAAMAVPVIYPPEIFPVFVPSHVDPDRDMMVGEHYLFLKLRDSTWLFQKELGRDPQTQGSSPKEEVDRLRSRWKEMTWSQAITPYREGSKP